MEVDGAVKTGGPQVRGRSGWPGGGGKLFCRQAGRRPVISLVLPRVPLELKAALVVAAVALYAYGLAAHPTAVGTVGSVLDPATADVLRREGGASADGDVHCGIGVVASPAASPGTGPSYGPVGEGDVPWALAAPRRLTDLQEKLGARRLVAAFRIAFRNPLWDEAHNVATGARYLAGTVVRPGETASLYRIIGPFSRERGYRDGPGYAGGRIVPTVAGGICKISSALYNLLIHSGVPVVERHPHSMPVPYIPPGRDATIAAGYKDLRFRNDTDSPLLFWAAVEDGALYVALYGDFEAPRVTWYQEELARQPTWTVRRTSSALAPGQERVVIEGHDGVTVRTWVTVTRAGEAPRRLHLGVDTYRPLPRVVEVGT